MPPDTTLLLDDLFLDDINLDELCLSPDPEMDALVNSEAFKRVMGMATAEVAARKRSATGSSSGTAKRTCIRIPLSILKGYKEFSGQHCVGYQTLMVRDLRAAMAARQASKTPPIRKP